MIYALAHGVPDTMRPHFVAVLLCVLFVLSALYPATMAAPEDEEIPSLRILFEDRNFEVGEQLNVTLEHSVNGVLTNADLESMTLAVIWNFTFGQSGNPSVEWYSQILDPPYKIYRVSVGIYKMNFTIMPDHVTTLLPMSEGLPFMGKVVFMMAMCKYGGGVDALDVSTMGMVPIEDGPSIQVTVTDHYPAPGERVDITVTTTNGTAVDAADVFVNLTSFDGKIESTPNPLTVTRESMGVYKASYTVPVDLAVATLYTIQAGASFADYNASVYLSPLFSTGFAVNFFDIWIQNVSSTDDMTEVAVWVADPDGNALTGVDVDANITVHDGDSSTSTDLANTTDTTGKAGFVISHPAADRVDVNGVISHGGRTQGFFIEAIIEKKVPEPPVPEELDDFIVQAWEMPEGSIFDSIKHPGDQIDTKYRAMNTTGPLANKRINWMLVDRDGFFDTNYTIIDSGFEVTDANGDFDISYDLPSSDVNAWLMFQAVSWSEDEGKMMAMEETVAMIDAGFFAVDQNIEITVDRVTKEAPMQLRAKIPLPESYFVGHFFAVIDEDDQTTKWGQPMGLGPTEDDFPIIPLQKVGVDTFGIDKQLPDFFPEDQSLAFLVLSVDLEAFRIQTNYIIMDYGESSNKGVDATVTDPDPIAAGTEGNFIVTVENTGQGTDTYVIEQTSGPEWLSWQVNEITVEPAGVETFNTTVAVPVDTDQGMYFFNVTVTSVGDETVNVTKEGTIEVDVNGVSLSTDEDEQTVMREGSANFVVAANNTGQGNDTYTLTLAGEAAAWTTLSDTQITAPENGEVEVVLLVDVPDDADEGSYIVNLTATSSDGVTADTITLTVKVQVNDVDVVADEVQVETFIEVPVSFTFNVTNTGQGSDTFSLSLSGDAANWSFMTPAELTLAEGETGPVIVEATPPEDIDEGEYEVILMAVSADGVTSHSALTLVKVWVNGVDLDADDSEKTGYRDGMVTFKLTLTNTGQGRDVYTLSHTGAEWAELVTFGSNPVGIDEGVDSEVDLTIRLPDDIDQDVYSITVTATSEDGVTDSSITLNINVVVNGVEVTLSEDSIEVKQGKTLEVTLSIKNTGQGADTFTLLLDGAASNWTEASRYVVTIDEGKTETITLTISVPKDTDLPDAFLDITVVSEDISFTVDDQLQVIVIKVDDDDGSSIWTFAIIGIAVAVIIILAILYFVLQKD